MTKAQRAARSAAYMADAHAAVTDAVLSVAILWGAPLVGAALGLGGYLIWFALAH